MQENSNILSVLENYLHDNPDEISMEIANDFRRRRIEKNLTREDIAKKSGVAISNIGFYFIPPDIPSGCLLPISNIARFEQKGLISLKNLISIAMVMEYTSEMRYLFASPKYSTMEELQQIKRNMNKKKAYK